MAFLTTCLGFRIDRNIITVISYHTELFVCLYVPVLVFIRLKWSEMNVRFDAGGIPGM